jgi:hypothetical protein
LYNNCHAAHLVILELNDDICVALQLNDLKCKCLFVVILTDKRAEHREYVPFNSGWFYLNVVEISYLSRGKNEALPTYYTCTRSE